MIMTNLEDLHKSLLDIAKKVNDLASQVEDIMEEVQKDLLDEEGPYKTFVVTSSEDPVIYGVVMPDETVIMSWAKDPYHKIVYQNFNVFKNTHINEGDKLTWI